MLFNSLDFAIFFPIVYILYWFVTNKSLKLQNLLILVASYYFYACWDWRFLFLLMFSTILDYYTGLKMHDSENSAQRKFWLWLSVVINLGFLGFFKYYNFFITSFAESISFLGYQMNPWTLNVVLPVGISFYTFHGLSYVIDIYFKRIPAERNFVDYAVFVSFFPLLVAGPIERATHLLPQVKKERVFDYSSSVDGLRQMLWGFFKKIVIADNCAFLADKIFNNYTEYNSTSLIFGALFFTLQIYGDFSGYSDIALGSARLLGFSLLQNFSFPYFSRDIAEFWRRWHISLSTWFKDYLYIPLGGSRGGTLMKVRNTFIIFLVSGFWHGANWTFIFWGFLNACYFLPLLLLNINRNNMDIVAKDRLFPDFKDFLSISVTFLLTVFAWIFFRSESMSQAFGYVGGIFNNNIFAKPDFLKLFPKALVFPMCLFIMVEWLGRSGKYALEKFLVNVNRPLRWGFYFMVVFMIGLFMRPDDVQFIYFQF